MEREARRYDFVTSLDRKGHWIPLVTQRRFWPLDPRPGDVDIEDIAWSLARICRFNGHLRCPLYSVAQHSVMCSRIVPKRYALEAELHDAPENIAGDCITPIKLLIAHVYEPIHDTIMDAVSERFGLRWTAECRRQVKRADRIMLATETRDLHPAGVLNGPFDYKPLPQRLKAVGARQARKMFLERFEELTSARPTLHRVR